MDDTALKVGDTATVTVVFSEAVTGLTVGDFDVANGSLSGLTTSNNITWTATYTPTANITDTSNVVSLPAGTVIDSDGNEVTTASNNTSANFTIDTAAPTVTSVVASGTGITNGAGYVQAGDVVTLTVNVSENVTVAGGTPTLTLSSGGKATYASGSGSQALVFNYTVGQSTADPDGLAKTSPVKIV